MAGCTQGCYQEDVAAVTVAGAVAQGAEGRHAKLLGIAAVIDREAVLHPAQDVPGRLPPKAGTERREPGREHLIGNAWRLARQGKILQHGIGHIAEVLAAKAGEHGIRLFRILLHKALDRAPVGTRRTQPFVPGRGEGRVGIGTPQAVLLLQAKLVGRLLSLRHRRQVVVGRGRNKCKINIIIRGTIRTIGTIITISTIKTIR